VDLSQKALASAEAALKDIRTRRLGMIVALVAILATIGPSFLSNEAGPGSGGAAAGRGSNLPESERAFVLVLRTLGQGNDGLPLGSCGDRSRRMAVTTE